MVTPAISQGPAGKPLDTDTEIDAKVLRDWISIPCPPTIGQALELHGGQSVSHRPTFRLSVRQHATHGLALGDGVPHARGARPVPLDPPIVCELAPEEEKHSGLLSVLEISLHARLIRADESGLVAATTALPLLGDVSQSAFVAQVFPPHEQSFFIFSELFVRPTGTFRIRFDIIDHSMSSFCVIGSITSNAFTVHEKKTYPGLTPSSGLILSIIDRGLKLRLNKAAEPRDKKISNGGKKRRRNSAASSTNDRNEVRATSRPLSTHATSPMLSPDVHGSNPQRYPQMSPLSAPSSFRTLAAPPPPPPNHHHHHHHHHHLAPSEASTGRRSSQAARMHEDDHMPFRVGRPRAVTDLSSGPATMRSSHLPMVRVESSVRGESDTARESSDGRRQHRLPSTNHERGAYNAMAPPPPFHYERSSSKPMMDGGDDAHLRSPLDPRGATTLPPIRDLLQVGGSTFAALRHEGREDGYSWQPPPWRR